MPAQGSKVSSSARRQQTSPNRKEQRPAMFMFIDSSNGGVNAKPDKVVRSFVMKSARNRKLWSTKSKSPRTEKAITVRTRRRSSTYSQSNHDHLQNVGRSLEPNYDSYIGSWETHSVTSSSSTQRYSSLSSRSNSWSSRVPISTNSKTGLEFALLEDNHDIDYHSRLASVRATSLCTVLTKSFSCLVVPLDGDAERLLHQVVEASIPHVLPIDPHQSFYATAVDWFATCIQSPIGAPFIYAALTSAARASALDTKHYKWRAISEVNRLLTDPSKNTDDTVIATVLMLLALEEADLAASSKRDEDRKGSVGVHKAHLVGLSTMIAQRGGLAVFSQNRCLQVFLLMHSIAQCITTFTPPYAVLLNTNGQIEDYCYITLQSPHSFTSILRHFHSFSIDQPLFRIVSTITVFISDLNTWYETGLCHVDSLDLQKHASLLMYRLFEWYKQEIHKRESESVDQSICLALLIFMVIATEPKALSFGSRLFKAVVRLRTSLLAVPLSRWSSSPDLLLWTLTMGALGAKSLPTDRHSRNEALLSFFTRCYRMVFFDRGLSMTVERSLEKMTECIWVPSIFDEKVKRLWKCMELCDAEVVEVDDMNSDGERYMMVDDEYALGQSTTLRFFTADGNKRQRIRAAI